MTQKPEMGVCLQSTKQSDEDRTLLFRSVAAHAEIWQNVHLNKTLKLPNVSNTSRPFLHLCINAVLPNIINGVHNRKMNSYVWDWEDMLDVMTLEYNWNQSLSHKGDKIGIKALFSCIFWVYIDFLEHLNIFMYKSSHISALQPRQMCALGQESTPAIHLIDNVAPENGEAIERRANKAARRISSSAWLCHLVHLSILTVTCNQVCLVNTHSCSLSPPFIYGAFFC